MYDLLISEAWLPEASYNNQGNWRKMRLQYIWALISPFLQEVPKCTYTLRRCRWSMLAQ